MPLNFTLEMKAQCMGADLVPISSVISVVAFGIKEERHERESLILLVFLVDSLAYFLPVSSASLIKLPHGQQITCLVF